MAYYGNAGYSMMQLGALYSFFKSKNALSAETASQITDEEFMELGLPGGFNYSMFWFDSWGKSFPVFKEGNSKYWFSVEAYKNQMGNSLKMVFIVTAIMLAFCFGIPVLLWLFLGFN